MKNFLITLLIIIIIVLTLGLTCPKHEDHKVAIKQVLTSTIYNKVGEDDYDATTLLSSIFAKPLIEATLDGMLYVDNYFIVSIGRIKHGDSDKIVSFGILGHVFTSINDKSDSTSK